MVYYSHAAVEGISTILIIVAWATYQSNGIFTSVECGIVLLFYVGFSIAMSFLFYTFYEEAIKYYDPDERAAYEAWKEEQRTGGQSLLSNDLSMATDDLGSTLSDQLSLLS